jgi:RNA polymerase sigma factor (sigma-70 family)
MNIHPPDSDCLDSFTRLADEEAFSALVRRHGAMVFRTARAIGGNQQDAEEVCQATFLALAKGASSLKNSGSVGPWLHQVATRIASRLHKQRHDRQRREMQAAEQ